MSYPLQKNTNNGGGGDMKEESRISFSLMETKNISKMDKGDKWSGQNIKNRGEREWKHLNS